jgi:argininosuccinate lyase
MSGPKGARGRRFEGALDPVAAALNASIGFDRRLLPHDVAASIAHTEMLAAQGLISAEDAAAIASGLRSVARRLAAGELTWDEALEDVHMNVEARLIDEIGDAGRRLHTARSRNDQVATDLRLYARDAAHRLIAATDELRRALVRQARRHVDTLMPGYTHLQRAQPVRLAHHLLAYDAMLERDRGRLADAARRGDVSPLGSGALAGTTLPIDRARVAGALGFAGVTHNSLDAVGDRDFAIELVAAIALAQVHLSRLGEELVLWTTSEFGFVRIGEAYCSGSSLMPQKMNPDLAELLRGKSGRVVGAWVTLMTVVKGLPLAYNKDLQEMQPVLFDTVAGLLPLLDLLPPFTQKLTFRLETMEKAATSGFLNAMAAATYLSHRGVPFRRAHHIIGEAVRLALDKGCELDGLTLEDLRQLSPAFAEDFYASITLAATVDCHDVIGGTARARVHEAVASAKARLTATPALLRDRELEAAGARS